MTSVYEVTNLAGVLSFAAWTLVVCAIAKFLFGSYPAAEVLYRLARRDRLRRQRIAELSAIVASRPSGESSDLRPRLEMIHAPLWQRVLSYFLTCFACQTFWSAVAVFAFSRETTNWRAWLFSAAAYSAAATLLANLSHVKEHVPVRTGCQSCGGR